MYNQPLHNPRTKPATIPRPISIEIELFGYLRLLNLSVFHLEVFDEDLKQLPIIRRLYNESRLTNFAH
jgi:hypothetical protein